VNILLAVVAVVVMVAGLGLIVWSARTVQRDYVPHARMPARELGTTVVAKVLPDGSETPRTTAAALLASRPARAEITRLGEPEGGQR
jgi:hypothetical protein